MHQLLPAPVPPDSFLSDRFRIHAVNSDSMEPTYRSGHDFTLIAPITTYDGEGVYLLNVGAGLDLFRVRNSVDGQGGLLLYQENRKTEYPMTLEKFEALVVGIVAADIRTRDVRYLRGR